MLIKFLSIHLLIGMLLLSWILPFSRPLWDSIDLAAFRGLNGLIREKPFWQGFWAVCNHPATDVFFDCIMVSFFVFYIKNGEKRKRISQLILCALYFFFSVFLINKTFIPDVIHPKRKSPSIIYRTHEDTTLLGEKISWIRVKQKSKTSFPGDHGTTAWLFVFAVFFFMGKRIGLLASAFGIFFCLPRLIVGAHWITDILMGSIPIAFLSSSWILLTPIESFFTKKLSEFFSNSILLE